MEYWGVLEVMSGFVCIAAAIFNQDFAPMGWIVPLIWGKNVEMPTWLADLFYLVRGAFFICDGLVGT